MNAVDSLDGFDALTVEGHRDLDPGPEHIQFWRQLELDTTVYKSSNQLNWHSITSKSENQ